MIDPEILSRPLRTAAELRGEDEQSLRHLFNDAHLMVRLEEAFADIADARETFQLVVNEALRFCPNIALCVPRAAQDLVDAVAALAVGIHGERHRVEVVGVNEAPRFQAVVNVGIEILAGLPSVTVNSTGWLARAASTGLEIESLYHRVGPFNPIGALAAACLGVGRAFLMLVGQQPPMAPVEVSLYTYEVGAPGSLPTGPVLPAEPLTLDGLLVGCGAVANGWAYAMKRLPVIGRMEAIDRQSLRIENFGAYMLASRKGLGKPKTELIRDYLSPAIMVTARTEEWEFFKIRLKHGLPVPRLVVNGLDNVEARHSVQRLWPETLIDMAAGGLTSQLIVKPRAGDGLCLLEALKRPEHEEGYAERLSQETGLRADRIRNEPTTPITEADVETAPPDKRQQLVAARQLGQLVCGHVTDQNLQMEGQSSDFAPAVPFVTGFSGVVGAGETMKWLMGHRYEHGLHWQHSSRSGRMRALAMRCNRHCDCQRQVSVT
jgi:hypothetical protein